MKPLVTIALHTGLERNTSLIENFLKSFLVCNRYPNIELMLVESGNNIAIRDWFEKLDFNNNFINFDGRITDIRKWNDCSIKKSLVFVEQNDGEKWFVPYYRSIQAVIDKAEGEYISFLVEDHQFVVVGDVISDYINIINEFGEDRTLIHLCTQQNYKYFKKNNRFEGPFTLNNGLMVFRPIEFKWTPYGFCSKKLYDNIGELKLFDEEEIGGIPLTEVDYSTRCSDAGFTRLYPSVFFGVWMYDHNHKRFNKIIKELTRDNPNILLYKIHDYSSTKELFKASKVPVPISTDYYDKINGFSIDL
ncbi:hypothetical protein CL614_08930 [archaeon]|nr:hypothetical protein [archaeon]